MERGDVSAAGHEEMKRLLAPYEFSVLTEDERAAFERHALECDACFEELERGSVVVAKLRENAGRLRDSMEGDLGSSRGSRSIMATWLRPRVAVPAFAVAVAVIAIVVTGAPRDYRKLATFPREEISSTLVRGAAGQDALRELLETGAGYFDLGRFAEAERHFEAALDRDPERAEAAYLLGLSRISQGAAARALPALEQAVANAPKESVAKYSWVLGNAYLEAGKLDEARYVLQRLANGPSEYAAPAEQLRRRLPR